MVHSNVYHTIAGMVLGTSGSLFIFLILCVQGSGRPALFFVSANGRADLVRKMLEREADPNIQDNVSIILVIPYIKSYLYL